MSINKALLAAALGLALAACTNSQQASDSAAEASQAAGEAQGLAPETARVLVLQTLLGAARMLSESGEPAAVLRQRVTSPGGTTQAAVETFEAGGFRQLVDQAIAAATRRGRELAAGKA